MSPVVCVAQWGWVVVDLDGVAAITSDQVAQVFVIVLFGSIGVGVLRTLTRTDLTWREKILGDPPSEDTTRPGVAVRPPPVRSEFAGRVEIARWSGRVELTGRGTVSRFDLDGLWSLLPVLREEWANLEFTSSGSVTNPFTAEPLDTLVLLDRRHRQPGAEYSMTPATPTDAAGSGPEGAEVTAFRLRLDVDDHRQLRVLVIDPDKGWSAQVTLAHGADPQLEIAFRANLNAVMANQGETSTAAKLLFGGKATADATLDTAALRGQSGDLASVSGQVNRFPFRAHLTVDSSPALWDLDFGATIEARRLGRILVLLAGGQLRREITSGFAGLAARWDGHVTDLRSGIQDLEAAIGSAGGPEQFVHRWLWDPTFNPQPVVLGD
ncbi:MAG: hypothetical protein GY701_02540 [Sulfitobacter sp.]|nr:hypothetical protein [Sulfitobacter sp.]